MKIKFPNHPLVGIRGTCISTPEYLGTSSHLFKPGMTGTIIDICEDSCTLCVMFDEPVFDTTYSINSTGCSGRGPKDRTVYVKPTAFMLAHRSLALTKDQVLRLFREMKAAELVEHCMDKAEYVHGLEQRQKGVKLSAQPAQLQPNKLLLLL